jgi:isopenicillin-N epimerase
VAPGGAPGHERAFFTNQYAARKENSGNPRNPFFRKRFLSLAGIDGAAGGHRVSRSPLAAEEASSMPAADWSAERAAMLLDPHVANLNTGSFGPLPRVVFDRATELRRRLAEEPMDFLLRGAPSLLWEARERLARFVGGNPKRLVFTANVTASVNLVASSLRLSEPGEVLLTDHEYGAMHWCWERAARRLGLSLRTFALPTRSEDPGEILSAAAAAMNEHTRLFFFSHVLSPTGLVLPARELCLEAKRRGILTMIDGAHAPGFVPVNLGEIGCDFYGANCHKWLLCPTGTGFLHFGPGSIDRVQPLQVSWGWYAAGAAPDERDEYGATPRIRRLEFEGTRDVCPWLTVPAGIDFQAGIGFGRIGSRMRELVRHTRARLTGLAGLTPATPENPSLSGAMTAFELPAGIDPVKLREGLWEERIELPVIERPDRLLIRTSTHFYNTEEEVDRLSGVLPGLLARARLNAAGD